VTAKVSLQQVNKTFVQPDGITTEALSHIDLDIATGELVAVLGPSGCGKTTLLNIIAGFLQASAGQVLCDNEAIKGPDAKRGMVFQQGALFEWMNVRRNIAFGPTMQGLDKQQIERRVDHLLQIVGLQGFDDKHTFELSGGMQQRVSLARCLANEPDVILMDEPLGALDALTREKMQALILQLWRETGKTILLITHSVEEALLLGQRVIVMAPRPGRIHSIYDLPFADSAEHQNLRSIKKQPDFQQARDEILGLIWEMEEQIMGTA